MRSNLHVLSVHDGTSWLCDELVEGDPGSKILELLGGLPVREKVLIPSISHVFFRENRRVLLMTFAPEIDRAQAEVLVENIREGREDTN